MLWQLGYGPPWPTSHNPIEKNVFKKNLKKTSTPLLVVKAGPGQPEPGQNGLPLVSRSCLAIRSKKNVFKKILKKTSTSLAVIGGRGRSSAARSGRPMA